MNYDMGPELFTQQNISQAEAEKFKKAYFNVYPGKVYRTSSQTILKKEKHDKAIKEAWLVLFNYFNSKKPSFIFESGI